MSDLRQRKSKLPDDDSSKDSDDSSMKKIDSSEFKYVTALADKAPSSLKPYLTVLISVLFNLYENIIPYIPIIYDRFIVLRKELAPHRLDLLLPGLIGLIMCFFGGSFVTLIAAAESYRLTGYESSLKCINDLKEDYIAFEKANKADDMKDDDNDGVADVNQIDTDKLIQRKTFLFLKTVNPKRLSDAFTGLNTAFFAVVATLKLQFAKAITLGHVLGSIIERPICTHFVPILELGLEDEYKKWALPLVSYAVKSIAISFAWFLQRILSSIHSAVRGGHMFSRNILEYLSIMGYVNINHNNTNLDEIVGYIVAFAGVCFQLSLGFKLPFPLNILLLPFTILEYVLMYIVGK